MQDINGRTGPPRLRVTSPPGWDLVALADEEIEVGQRSRILASASHAGRRSVINVTCRRIDQLSQLASTFIFFVNLLVDEGRVVSCALSDKTASGTTAQDSGSHFLSCVLDKNGFQTCRRLTVKMASENQGRAIIVYGIWPESDDEQMVKIYDMVAATADFR